MDRAEEARRLLVEITRLEAGAGVDGDCTGCIAVARIKAGQVLALLDGQPKKAGKRHKTVKSEQ